MTTARTAFRCLLGDQEIALDGFDGQQTLLDFLRLDQGLTGTKEGCAEGDCGACTVLLGRLENNQLYYQPVNACIIPLGTVDSTQVLTVEHLADPQPHPVQLEMANAHGSQCGFCTPGIVMSLAALHYACDSNDFTVGRETLNDALAGNLCRCTGYGPIITAAQQALVQPIPDHCRSLQALGIQTLSKWASDDTYLQTNKAANIFAAPTSLADLTELMRALPEAQLIAGATDVGLWITKQHRRFDNMIYLGQVTELKQIHRSGQEVQIGAALTLAQSLEVLEDLAPDLGTLLHRFGSRQVRAQATLGGNIANGSPIGDLAPALIALGATLHLLGPNGERTLALEDFFIDYGHQDRAAGEIIRMIGVPTQGHEHFHCWKVSKRFDQDISAVCGAFNLQLDNGIITSARIAFGGMAGTVQRAHQCESALVGKSADGSALESGAKALAQDFSPITDARASADYRMHAARGLLERYLGTISNKAPDLLYPANAAPGLSAHG